jgi:putative ABC transport system substrate-binding protein
MRPTAIGVSLAVDPALLFSTLKRLAPQTQRVFVVFNPDRERWIIERAQQAASGFNLTLAPLEAKDLHTSAHQFLRILDSAQAGTDAIWLTVDSQLVDTQAILPVIIEQSWRRRLVVFSNNLEHANLGVLFAVFPDNRELGWRLADLALALDSHPDRHPGVEPLRAVKRALNLRVAAHLDLAITQSVEKQFDLVFR